MLKHAWAYPATGDKVHICRAKKEPDWDAFDAANRAEVQALWTNNTWELVDLPFGKTIPGTQMLCERKRGAAGEVQPYKGRLVARGDTQRYGVNYSDVWAPVARYATVRALLYHCAAAGLYLNQMDVETAILNGEATE